MNKHTPGPWTAEIILVGYASNGYRIDGGGEFIARTHTRDEGCDEANARLIAAAPDLLDSLERIALAASATVCNTDWIARHAMEAIAKARGEA